MSVALDATQAAETSFGSNWTSPVSVTNLTITASGTALLVIVAIIVSTGTPPTVTGVTWNGVSMTQLGTIAASDTSSRIYAFGLGSPTTGNHTVSISTSGSAANAGMYVEATSWSGTDTTTANAFPTANVVTDASTPAGGTYPTGSFTVTTANGDIAFAGAANNGSNAWTGLTSGTFLHGYGDVQGNFSDGYRAATTASTTLQFTGGPSSASTGIAVRIAQPSAALVLGWLRDQDVFFLTKPRFTDPRATDGTPPYTLPPKIAGMAWFERQDVAFVTKPRFTDPRATDGTPPYTLPPKIAGMAWLEPWDQPNYGIKTFTYPAALTPQPPISVPNGWEITPNQPFYGIKGRTDPSAVSLTPATLPPAVAGMSWFEPWDQPNYGVKTFTYPTALATQPMAPPPNGWEITPDQSFYGKPARTDPAAIALTPATLPPVISGMGWFEAKDFPSYARRLYSEQVPGWDPQQFTVAAAVPQGWYVEPDQPFYTKRFYIEQPQATFEAPQQIFIGFFCVSDETTYAPPTSRLESRAAWDPQVVQAAAQVPNGWWVQPDQPLYDKRFLEQPSAFVSHASLPPIISGIGWFQPWDQPNYGRKAFTTPIAWEISPAGSKFFMQQFTVLGPQALPRPPYGSFLGKPTIIPGIGWFQPWDQPFYGRKAFTDPPVFAEPPYVQPPLVVILPDQPFYGKKAFTDPLGRSPPPPPAGISGMAWFTPPERAFFGRASIANAISSWDPQFVFQNRSYTIQFTVLGPQIVPRPPYGSFQGKPTPPPPSTGEFTVSGWGVHDRFPVFDVVYTIAPITKRTN